MKLRANNFDHRKSFLQSAERKWCIPREPPRVEAATPVRAGKHLLGSTHSIRRVNPYANYGCEFCRARITITHEPPLVRAAGGGGAERPLRPRHEMGRLP